MPDALIAVVITALTSIVAGVIPNIMSAVQATGRDKRDRLERIEIERQRLLRERRTECGTLLRMARDFQVAVENNYEYSGTDKTARVWDIRQRAADITGRAEEISLLIPDLDGQADALADEASRLARLAADPQSLKLGASTQPPDTGGLGQRIRELKSAAQGVLYDGPAATRDSLVPGELERDLPVRLR